MDGFATTLPDDPDDPDALKASVASLGAQVRSLEAAVSTRQLIIETLQIQLVALRRQRFGRKSEKLDEQIAQLESKLEEFQADEAEDPTPTTEAVKSTRTKRARKPLPDHLPRDIVTYPEPACDCPNCGGTLQAIGEDVAEQLEFIPASFRVIRHVRPKFGCTQCNPVPVLAPGRGKTVIGRPWASVRDERPAKQRSAPALWMAYLPNRKGEHAQAHPQNFTDVIHVDGFASYDRLYNDTRVEAACWAHVRRKFYDISQ